MRGQAYRRAQDDRARRRSRRLIRTILGHTADDPTDDCALSPEKVARLERMYAVDRTPHRPRGVRGEHRQERRARASEQEQRP